MTNARAELAAIEDLCARAEVALTDEAEGDFRDAVAGILAHATALDALVSSW